MRLAALVALLAWLPLSAAAQDSVDTLRSVCAAGVGSADATLQTARQSGWSTVEHSDDARLASAYELSQSLAPSEQAWFLSSTGGSQHLLVTRGPDRVGCFVLDFAARTPVSADVVNGWINASPSAREDHDFGLHMVRWDRPAGLEHVVGVGLIFIEGGSEAASALGITGTMSALVSQP